VFLILFTNVSNTKLCIVSCKSNYNKPIENRQCRLYCCTSGVKSSAGEGPAAHILNVIFMFYSSITISYKLYYSIYRGWKLRWFCFNECRYWFVLLSILLSMVFYRLLFSLSFLAWLFYCLWFLDLQLSKQISSSSHCKLTFSRHGIAKQILHYRQTTITHY
jgi:hypothetical protein